VFGASAVGSSGNEALAAEFVQPPMSSGPRTWWHWLSNNISKEGITKDLEAMKEMGVKGTQVFGMPQGHPFGDVDYLTPEWMEMSKHAAKESARLGLDLGFSNAIGCSGAGGPWITPELSMQKLVWTETRVMGPFNGEVTLPHPKIIEGFYRDVAVFAFPTLPGDATNLSALAPKVSSNIPNLTSDLLIDGDTGKGIDIQGSDTLWNIDFEFAESQSFSSLHVVIGDLKKHQKRGITAFLWTSQDGSNWTRRGGTDVSQAVYAGKALQITVGMLHPSKSRFHRVQLQIAEGKHASLREVQFAAARLPGITQKAARGRGWVVHFNPSKHDVPEGQAIASGDVKMLRGTVKPDGTLACSLPAGDWTLLRVGHTSTGRRMVPASPEHASNPGLEADKMDREAILHHLNHGLPGKIARQLKQLKNPPKVCIMIDSWECGEQTWTKNFAAEFRKRRGYDCMNWLPALTGRIIESVDMTERVLWDFRRTVADLYAEKYFGTFRDFCHENGMLFEGEVPGIGIPAIADGLQCLGLTDTPMGEFWIRAKPGPHAYLGLGGGDNTKEAAVASHVYGQEIAACEAFTSFGYADGWRMDPRQLKPIGDRQFVKGMNEMVFHTYAHQHDEREPGMTLGQFGLNFTRKLTWWEQGRAWIKYITRCQHMLRQGLFVADVCYFYGENGPSSVHYYAEQATETRKMHLPMTPKGYDFDCSDRTVLERMRVENGRVVLPHGMSYPYLVVPHNEQMTLGALETIRKLVFAGATVVGPPPVRTPTLTGYPEAETKREAIVKELWPQQEGPEGRRVGKGRVIHSKSFDEVFAHDGLIPDFEAVFPEEDADIRYIHRVQGDLDFYFVCNQQERTQNATLRFRVTGKVPEIWHPETGAITRAPVYKIEGKRTAVAVQMKPHESFFVVFRNPARQDASLVKLEKDGQSTGLQVVNSSDTKAPGAAAAVSTLPDVTVSKNKDFVLTAWQAGHYTGTSPSGATWEAKVPSVPVPLMLKGPWRVSFQSRHSAPEGETEFPELISWPDHPDEAIKYFSGTAAYRKSIGIQKDQLMSGRKLHLDLGEVKNVAEVFVNGKKLGTLWTPPFRMDITPALRAGENEVEIRVTNLWRNRLVGDQKLPESERTTWGFYRFYDADSPLAESGLLGPVKLLSSVDAKMTRQNDARD
jgi:hypothetical protein